MAAQRRGAVQRAARSAGAMRAHTNTRPPPRRARRAQGARVGLVYDLVMLLHKRNGAFVPRARAWGGYQSACAACARMRSRAHALLELPPSPPARPP